MWSITWAITLIWVRMTQNFENIFVSYNNMIFNYYYYYYALIIIIIIMHEIIIINNVANIELNKLKSPAIMQILC
jgi:hypothetical protein